VALAGVELSFGSRRILTGIDLSVGAGQKLVIIGPSGSGKSTLLRCVNGLERPDRGSVTIFGQSLAGSARTLTAARRRMGVIFQQFNLYSMLSVRRNVTLAPRRLLGLSRQEADAWAHACLARVEVAHLADKYPFQISGGQQQRVAIARALAMRPEILLLDEPTSALDPELVRSLLDLLESVARDGMTVLCVTHELGFARRLADRVVFMAEGRIVEEGAVADLLRSPRTKRLRDFLIKLAHEPDGGAG